MKIRNWIASVSIAAVMAIGGGSLAIKMKEARRVDAAGEEKTITMAYADILTLNGNPTTGKQDGTSDIDEAILAKDIAVFKKSADSEGTNPRWWGDSLRVYKKNKFTISVPDGQNIAYNSIEFAGSPHDKIKADSAIVPGVSTSVSYTVDANATTQKITSVTIKYVETVAPTEPDVTLSPDPAEGAEIEVDQEVEVTAHPNSVFVDPITYAWTVESGAEFVSLTDADKQTVKIKGVAVGTAHMKLVVSDESEHSVTKEADVVVVAKEPVINLNDPDDYANKYVVANNGKPVTGIIKFAVDGTELVVASTKPNQVGEYADIHTEFDVQNGNKVSVFIHRSNLGKDKKMDTPLVLAQFLLAVKANDEFRFDGVIDVYNSNIQIAPTSIDNFKIADSKVAPESALYKALEMDQHIGDNRDTGHCKSKLLDVKSAYEALSPAEKILFHNADGHHDMKLRYDAWMLHDTTAAAVKFGDPEKLTIAIVASFVVLTSAIGAIIALKKRKLAVK